MNSRRIVEAAIRRTTPAPAPDALPSLRAALAVLLPDAMDRVSLKVGGSKDRATRNLLRKGFSATLSSGTADLSSLLAGTQPVLLDLFRTADIRHAASGLKVQMLADRASLDQDKPSAFLFGAVEGVTLYVPGAADGPLAITASYAEKSVANWKQQLETLVIDELAGMHAPQKAAA